MILSSAIAIYTGFTKNFLNFTIFNSLYSLTDNISGNFCVLLSVEYFSPIMKSYALGMFQLAIQIFAFFPAPLAYSEIKLYFNSSKIAMRILLNYSVIGSLCMIWCLINKIRKVIKEKGKKKLIDETI